MATYLHSFDEWRDAVITEIKRLDSTIQAFPTDTQLQSYWNDYVSVEKAAQDWIDWCNQ